MSAADPTPPRADDHQEREALADLIRRHPMCNEEDAHDSDTIVPWWQCLAGDILAAGFRRVAPEPVRKVRVDHVESMEIMDPDTLKLARAAFAAFPKPEPQQQGGEGKLRVQPSPPCGPLAIHDLVMRTAPAPTTDAPAGVTEVVEAARALLPFLPASAVDLNRPGIGAETRGEMWKATRRLAAALAAASGKEW